MEPETNPYAAPVAPSSISDRDDDLTSAPTALSGSLAIDVICFLLLLAVLVSLGQFGYQAMYQMPDGERFITISPLWVCSHLVRAIGLLILVWQLFWYGKAIERVETPEEMRALSFRHGRLWTWVTIVLLAFMAYGGILFVAPYVR